MVGSDHPITIDWNGVDGPRDFDGQHNLTKRRDGRRSDQVREHDLETERAIRDATSRCAKGGGGGWSPGGATRWYPLDGW